MNILGIIAAASIFPLAEDCNRVIISWNHLAVLRQRYQAQEVRVGDVTTGGYLMTRDRGFAGAGVIMQPVCGGGQYFIDIRFAKNCVKAQPEYYWYHKDNVCEWEAWTTIWFSSVGNKPQAPVNLTIVI